MSNNTSTSTYERDYFAQDIIQQHNEFQEKYFYEFYENAKFWSDYVEFFNRFLTYYLSVVSYYLLGIFLCPEHQFEEELKLNVYKRIKVALKEEDFIYLSEIIVNLSEEEFKNIWNKAVEDDGILLLIKMMNTRPLCNLDGLSQADYNLFERHLGLPENKEFLLRQFESYRMNASDYGVESTAFFNRICLQLMSAYEILCGDLSASNIQAFKDLYQILSEEEKEGLWQEAILQKNVMFVEFLLSQNWQGAFKDEYLPFLLNHELSSQHFKNYLKHIWLSIPLTTSRYQLFLNRLKQNTYEPNYTDCQILRHMSMIAPSANDYLKIVREFEFKYLLAKKNEMLSLDIHKTFDAESEWVFAFKKITELKKENPKNKDWDEVLRHLSQNQSLVNSLSKPESSQPEEIKKNKFRPLNGTIGPVLKQWKNHMFVNTANLKEGTLTENQKSSSSRNLI